MQSRPSSRSGSSVVALVATRDRDGLLFNRAIPSILAQTRMPDRLVVVVDRSKEELSDEELAGFETKLRGLCAGRLHVSVLRNRRTPCRAAGAWNSGIDHLHRDAGFARHPDRCFVAILDDDDAWTPDHIARCVESSVDGGFNMVASGLVRRMSPDDPGHRHALPDRIDPREQFIKGQHIQGSNLFLRLDVLLEVGLFDEYLPSCTDRDICIRLAGLPILRFGCTGTHTVHHYADRRADRLSAPGSRAKLDGLSRFWRKHADRFDAEARREAAERARTLFGWEPSADEPAVLSAISPLQPSTRSLELVVGFVTDADPKRHVWGLLDDLVRLGGQPDVSGVHIVVIENGPIPASGDRPLHRAVATFRERGLSIELVDIERQREDWALGLLIDTPDPTSQRLPIAVTRTILNTYVARASAERPGAAAWILDDDKRLEVCVETADGTEIRQTPDIGTLLELRDSGVDVVIGPDTDAAPLPFTATVRLQLLDLDRHLALVAQSGLSGIWLDRRHEDRATKADLPDSYYDLAKHTEHLETPFSIRPPEVGMLLGESLIWIAPQIDRLLAGEALFRPLTLSAEALDPDAATESAQRGGSTIFFNPQHLLAYPQTLARLGDRFVRRSDMLVTQLMRDQMGLRIVTHASAGVRHDRSCTSPAHLDDHTLWADVLGYALYRAANEVMLGREAGHRRAPLLAWAPDELDKAVHLVQKYVEERLAAFTLSAQRIRGLADTIRGSARRLAASDNGFVDGPQNDALGRIAREMDRIWEMYSQAELEQFAEKISRSISEDDIRNTFMSIDGLISEYRATHEAKQDLGEVFQAARGSRAQALVRRAFGTADLRVLGTGGEGVVLTDERNVYKVFDLLKRRPNHDTEQTLRTLSQQSSGARHLYPIERIEIIDGVLVVVYPFEDSQPYTGGHGAGLIALLRECRELGIVFRNMHPKNLRVSDSGLKLIDYGSDIRPFSDDGFRSMAERAWLTWRWPQREDLDEVMRRALLDKSLPEMDGFERFWRVVCEHHPSATRIVAEMVAPLVEQTTTRRLLDYGCGKRAWSARHFAGWGIFAVVGYDPDPQVAARWSDFEPLPSSLTLTHDREAALRGGPFDTVLCSLVLCELGDGEAYEQVLSDLRAAVSAEGTVFITICNPHATFSLPTNLHRRRDLPEGVTYSDSFWYTENAESGRGRREYHRPLHKIERDLLRHGLRVEERLQSETVDTERFEPASDFMTLLCRPVNLPECPPVSLLIKTCAMEHATIERQVEHLVEQLEGPRVFAERVLVIDSRTDGFVRQHANGDAAAMAKAVERLGSHGLIDRVILAPGSGGQARDLLGRWFGIDCDATHSSAGAPLVAPLLAFEQCRGDYVLQVDSDLLIHRGGEDDDYLHAMVRAIESDPLAVTASLSVPTKERRAFSGHNDGVPWRVEVRGCLLHRARLLAGRPYPNGLENGLPRLSWHRAMDEAAKEGRITSLRGSPSSMGFVHPANEIKEHTADWMLMLGLVERCAVPEGQFGKVDLVGGPLDWYPRNRSEPFIFIVTGRNVSAGRIARCVASMAAQSNHEWGAIIIDDGSDRLAREAVQRAVEPWSDRITLVQPRERRGQMANMTLAIRHICTNPHSVIVTLDLDDALIGTEVLEQLAEEYESGTEFTIGSMLRTDKHAVYPVDLQNPRGARGGNVWQHLRTFRKFLFDAIPDRELRVDGRYVDIAVDWSFMLPIVELAERGAWVKRPLYLYEPSGLGKGSDRDAREAQIGVLTKRPRLPRLSRRHSSTVLRVEDMDAELWDPDGGVLFVRHAERPSFHGLSEAEKHAVEITSEGREMARRLGKRLGKGIWVLSSPVPRALRTAAAIIESSGARAIEPCVLDALAEFRLADQQQYDRIKSRLGWGGLMAAWMDGSLPPGLLRSCHQVARAAVGESFRVLDRVGAGQAVAVSHDFVIMSLAEAIHGHRCTQVPYLGGIVVDRRQAQRLLAMEAE